MDRNTDKLASILDRNLVDQLWIAKFKPTLIELREQEQSPVDSILQYMSNEVANDGFQRDAIK